MEYLWASEWKKRKTMQLLEGEVEYFLNRHARSREKQSNAKEPDSGLSDHAHISPVQP